MDSITNTEQVGKKWKIELSTEDMELFKVFREHQTEFMQLLNDGIFDDYTGSKTIHKDGKLIRKIDTTYNHKF